MKKKLTKVISKNSMKFLQTSSVILLGISATTVYSAPVINYGEDVTALKQSFAQRNLHILQIGDSHTAGDYFTEQLRKRLQRQIGDGGIGYAPPLRVKGQRVARHGYRNNGWSLLSSRTDSAQFPLGGFLAENYIENNQLTLTSQYYSGQKMQAKIMVSGQGKLIFSDNLSHDAQTVLTNNNSWQSIQRTIQFPLDIQSIGDVKIGGFWLQKPQGGVVSAMGINGSQINHWNRWSNSVINDITASNAQLVILAYGTNEAFSGTIGSYESALRNAISKIRQALPRSSLLLIGAPDSLKNRHGNCGKRPPQLTQIQTITQDIAEQEQTLYWSWQDAMGGSCSMKKWIQRGFAAPDGVHFRRKGYDKAANDLFDNLLYVLDKPHNSNNTTPITPTKSAYKKPTPKISSKMRISWSH